MLKRRRRKKKIKFKIHHMTHTQYEYEIIFNATSHILSHFFLRSPDSYFLDQQKKGNVYTITIVEFRVHATSTYMLYYYAMRFEIIFISLIQILLPLHFSFSFTRSNAHDFMQ